MRERAEMLSGSLLVNSRPGAGTRVELRVPLDGQSYLRSEGSAYSKPGTRVTLIPL